MNKKLLVAMLPILGSALIVGSGFSAFVFTVEPIVNNLTGTIEPAPAIDGYKLTLEDTTFSLYLDQGGVANMTNPDAGISVYDAEHAVITETILDVQIEHYDSTSFSMFNFDYTIDLAIADGTVSTYVKVNEENNQVKGKLAGEHTSIEIPLVFSYVKKPQSYAEYDAMVTELKRVTSFNLQLTFSLEITDNVA